MKKFLVALLAPACLLSFPACTSDSGDIIAPDTELFESFSSGLGAWIPLDLDLAPGSSFTVVEEGETARFDFDAVGPDGEGILAREFIVAPGVDYTVVLSFQIETGDTVDVVEPWGLVVGTSVEGSPWVFNDELDTATFGPTAEILPVQGDLSVTSGAPTGDDDSTSEVRVAIGFRPLTAAIRTYRLDNVLVRFFDAAGD